MKWESLLSLYQYYVKGGVRCGPYFHVRLFSRSHNNALKKATLSLTST